MTNDTLTWPFRTLFHQDRAGTREACQIKRRLTERLDGELHDVGRHGRDPVGAGLEVHLDDGIARRRRRLAPP